MSNEEIKKEKKPFNKKKLKYGSLATIVTVIFVAAVVMVNLIAGLIEDKHSLKVDLTENKFFEISDQTTDYLKNLKSDVNIAIMSEKTNFETNTYMKMISEIMEKYKQSSERIDVEYYDIQKNPEVISKYSKYYSGEITEGNIVVSSGERVKVLSVNDLFTQETDYTTYTSSITGFKGEQELTSAVMNVTDANPKSVAFISNYNGSAIYHSYNQYSIKALQSLLDKNGYQITEIDLMTGELSSDYDMVILPAPMNDLTDGDIEKLDKFLYNDGNLDKDMIYIADVNQYATPNIDEFLALWGIEVDDSMIYEYDNNKYQYVNLITGSTYAPVASITDDTYKEGLSNTKLPIVAPYTRPINLLFDENNERSTKALLTTSDTSFLYPLNMQTAEQAAKDKEDSDGDEQATDEFNADDAEKAAQNAMAIAKKVKTGDTAGAENNLMVLGSASLMDYQISSDSSYNNAEFIINAINIMSGKESGIVIAEKDLSIKTISITASQLTVLKNVVIFILPLIIVAIGVVVFVRRKNR